MFVLKEGDVFLHAKQYDSDDHPLKCKIVNIENELVTWIRADSSWSHITSSFYLADAEKNILRLL